MTLRAGHFFHLLSASLAALSLASCSEVPSGVIPPKEMSSLLADIHVGESFVEYNSSTFSTDSAKENLRQSIYRAHGVNDAEVDSSLVWYARHIDVYNEVYEHTIEILEDRQQALGNLIAAQAAISFSGDSVDIWTGSRHVEITPRSPSQGLRFDLPTDSTLRPGDSYTWRIKLLNHEPNISIQWNTVAEYTDGSMEVYSTSTGSRTWHEVSFVTDSTLTLSSLRSSAIVKGPATEFYLDSITLVRKRLSPGSYGFHAHQRKYHR